MEHDKAVALKAHIENGVETGLEHESEGPVAGLIERIVRLKVGGWAIVTGDGTMIIVGPVRLASPGERIVDGEVLYSSKWL